MLNLLGGQMGHSLSKSMTGVEVPSTPPPSMAQLMELSARVEGGKTSSLLLHNAWSMVFEPMSDACGPNGHSLYGALRPAQRVHNAVTYDLVPLPVMRVAVMRA
eukprot:5129196-Prymnesium_polylepis.1